MIKTILTAAATAIACCSVKAQTQVSIIGKSDIVVKDGLMTPETLWAMGRIAAAAASPDGKTIVYQVGYYSVEQNKSRQTLHIVNVDGTGDTLLTTDEKSETDPAWTTDGKIAFLKDGQLWTMNADGTDRQQLTDDKTGIDGFLLSPDGQQVILIKQIPFHESILQNPADLPLATGRLVTDLNYRHWDEYVETIPHPFLADITPDGVGSAIDILEGEPYECPTKPFGGVEQIAWSPDAKTIAYTCRKKKGVEYAISTDTDIYLYNVETRETRNICKPADYEAPATDATKTMKTQAVNSADNLKNNPGYDANPAFSPDGKRIAWQSMARDGYESDRNRLCIYNLETHEKSYVTETFDTNVDAFCWGADSEALYFTAVWHGCTNVYRTDLNGNVARITDDRADYLSVALANDGDKLLVMRQSITNPTDIYIIEPGNKAAKGKGKNDMPDYTGKTVVTQITNENKHILDQLSAIKVEPLWTKADDGKDILSWIVLPSNFDPTKKYPTLLFCEGGPQSPVSQFWSYRWNFRIMAANGYVIVAPNRRGLPGFGSEWNEQISGDWTGQCMKDLLSAIDAVCDSLDYIDKDRLGAVGASFGGFSVYWLAGHHDGRFKCFIAHDGAFNLESMYTDTEEVWFSNWEYDDAFWNKDLTDNARRTYDNSPHRFVDKWDTPILCIHGEKDYRINANQGFGAFNAARLKGIPAELLIFPDENHWVLKPQNGILWQRTFFSWLDRWLKPEK